MKRHKVRRAFTETQLLTCTLHELCHQVNESNFALPYSTSSRSITLSKVWPWRKQYIDSP